MHGLSFSIPRTPQTDNWEKEYDLIILNGGLAG
jgi:hypothetical protein